jgi:hypothetical protein
MPTESSGVRLENTDPATTHDIVNGVRDKSHTLERAPLGWQRAGCSHESPRHDSQMAPQAALEARCGNSDDLAPQHSPFFSKFELSYIVIAVAVALNVH